MALDIIQYVFFNLSKYGGLCTNDNIDRNTPTLIPGTYKEVAFGFYHIILLDSNGFLWSCGFNSVLIFIVIN
jgi:hypothetical protein